MNRISCILVALLLCACGYDRFDPRASLPSNVGPEPAVNTSIAMLKADYESVTLPAEMLEDMIVKGVVTSSDRAGNFYRTLVVEQRGAAVEIMAGLYDMHNIYPIGCELYILARGLMADRRNGILRLGLRAQDWSYNTLSYIGYRSLLDRYIVPSGVVAPLQPAVKTVAGLQSADCGSLIEVRGLHYTGLPADCWTTGRGEETLRKFCDDDGRMIAVYTSGYASYAHETIPAGRVSVRGILELTGDAPPLFALKMRDASDIAATF